MKPFDFAPWALGLLIAVSASIILLHFFGVI